MTETPTPAEIYSTIQEQQIAMHEAIRPLALELGEIVSRFQTSVDGQRLIELTSLLPPVGSTTDRLRNIITVLTATQQSIANEFPPEPEPIEEPAEPESPP